MRISCCVLFLLVPLLLSAQRSRPPNVNWHALEIAWTAYKTTPTDKNANRVYKILPVQKPDSIPTSDIGSRVGDSIYYNLDIVEAHIQRRSRGAVRLAFRLYTISDGDFSETLVGILGKIIRIDPKLFLQELRNHRQLFEKFGFVTVYFQDDSLTEEQELRLRVRALESVKDSSLKAIRDECIAELTSDIEYFLKKR